MDAILAWCVLWQQEQQVCVGRQAGWKHQVHLGCLLRMSLRLPSRQDLLVLGQSGSLWTCVAQRPPCPSMPYYSCATRLFAMLQAGPSCRAEMIGCAISCAHGCSRNHPVSCVYIPPVWWLSFQFAWGSSSSEPILFSYQVLTLPSSVPGTEVRSLHSVPLVSLSSQETRRRTSVAPFLRVPPQGISSSAALHRCSAASCNSKLHLLN